MKQNQNQKKLFKIIFIILNMDLEQLPNVIIKLIYQYIIFIPKNKEEIKYAIGVKKSRKKYKYKPIELWNTKYITDMSDLFKFETNFDEDISNWNVSNVTNMERMFYGCKKYNSPLDNWDVSSVINMESMFEIAKLFNVELG